jgi:hypothetical protein
MTMGMSSPKLAALANAEDAEVRRRAQRMTENEIIARIVNGL